MHPTSRRHCGNGQHVYLHMGGEGAGSRIRGARWCQVTSYWMCLGRDNDWGEVFEQNTGDGRCVPPELSRTPAESLTLTSASLKVTFYAVKLTLTQQIEFLKACLMQPQSVVCQLNYAEWSGNRLQCCSQSHTHWRTQTFSQQVNNMWLCISETPLHISSVDFRP